MAKHIATTSDMRIMNRNKIYLSIYHSVNISKQALAQELHLSLPTVTQNLNELQELHLIEKNGLYESTGGRKAQVIHCVETARIAVGLDVSKEIVRICAIDLYGTLLKEDSILLKFQNEDSYFQRLGSWVNRFVKKLPYPEENLLGIKIGVQGLVNKEGTLVFYSAIFKCPSLPLSSFQNYIDYPCSLAHDTETAATAALWKRPDIQDAVYLALNNNFSGTLIINGEPHQGKTLSGVIEHMCLVPGGLPCYCGKNGCMECYCSADALVTSSGEALPDFFKKLRRNDKTCAGLWDCYMKNLARGINNIRMVMDGDFILGGVLKDYLIDSDLETLHRYVQEESSFQNTPFALKLSNCGSHSTMLGAALLLIKQFLLKFQNED